MALSSPSSVHSRCRRRTIPTRPPPRTTGSGDTVDYDKLLLATGAVPRRLSVPGADSYGVFSLRTREDSDAIRACFGDGNRLVIIGAGWIGLEVAAAARVAGTDVTVIEVAELPLLGVLGPELAQVFADLHAGNGVDLRLGAQVSAITTDADRVIGVQLADGHTVPADAVTISGSPSHTQAAGSSPLCRSATISVASSDLIVASVCE